MRSPPTGRSGCRSSGRPRAPRRSRSPDWRNQELPLPGGGLLINDAWNANPVSMRAALEHLRERAGDRRTVAVLGEMAELGDYSEEGHREVGRAVEQIGIDVVVAVGPQAQAYGGGAGSRAPTRRPGSSGTCSSRATACSSRAPARSPWKASPTNWRTCPRHGPSPDRGHRRPGDLDRARPEADRVPAPQRVRPADPRGGPAARREAGNARDGRPPDHGLDGRRRSCSSRSTRSPERPSSSARSPARRSASGTTSSRCAIAARSACADAGSCSACS